MRIKKASLSDGVKLYKLENTLFDQKNYPLSRSSFRYHILNNLLLVFEIEDKIAGYILMLVKRKDAKLYSIGVDKCYRGKKIAYKLLKKALIELKASGFKRVLLEVRIDNEAAISLYEKAGFNTIKKLNSFYLDGCDAYLMELKYAAETL